MGPDEGICSDVCSDTQRTADDASYERGRIASVRQRATAYAPAYAVPALMSLAVIPLLTRELGPHEFGIYAVCLSIHGCALAFAADPTSGSLSRFYSMTSGLAERRRLSKSLLGFTVVLATGVAATFLLLVVGAALVTDLGSWGWALAATAVMTALFTIVQYLLTVIYVQERALAMSLGQVAHSLAKSAGLVAGAFVVGTAAGSLFGYGVACAVLLVILIRAVVRCAGPFFDAALWRRAARYGFPLVASSLSFVALASFDRAVLAAMNGAEVAGVYAATYLVAEGVVSLPALLLRSAVFTAVMEAHEEGDAARVKSLIRGAGDALLLVAAPAVAAFSLEGGRIIEIVGGGEYQVRNLVPGLIAVGLVAFRFGTLDGLGFQLVLSSGGLARTFLYATGIALPITAAFIAWWGLEGAAAATLVAYVGFFALTRARSPLRELTAYPGKRLALAATATVVIVAVGTALGTLAALGTGALLWSVCAVAVAGDVRSRATR